MHSLLAAVCLMPKLEPAQHPSHVRRQLNRLLHLHKWDLYFSPHTYIGLTKSGIGAKSLKGKAFISYPIPSSISSCQCSSLGSLLMDQHHLFHTSLAHRVTGQKRTPPWLLSLPSALQSPVQPFESKRYPQIHPSALHSGYANLGSGATR